LTICQVPPSLPSLSCDCSRDRYVKLPAALSEIETLNGTDVAGMNAIVTGGSRGLGRYIVLKLADLGVRVFDLSRTEPCNNAASELYSNSTLITHISTDISKGYKVELAVHKIKNTLLAEQRNTKINMFFLNAALIDFEFPQDSFALVGQDVFDVNLFGNWRVFLACVRDNMVEYEGFSRVAWTSSINSNFATAGPWWYALSKISIERIFSWMNVAWNKYTSVKVFSIHPDGMRTQLGRAGCRSPVETCPTVFAPYGIPSYLQCKVSPHNNIDNCLTIPFSEQPFSDPKDVADAWITVITRENPPNYHYHFEEQGVVNSAEFLPPYGWQEWSDLLFTSEGVYNQENDFVSNYIKYQDWLAAINFPFNFGVCPVN